MPIDGIQSYQSPQNANVQTNGTGKALQNALNKDDFLMLLIESLKNQDPMSPMDNSEMLQQMSMLGLMEASTNMSSSVDKMVEMNEKKALSDASSYIGKTVKVVDENGQFITGVAEKVENFGGGIIGVNVNGKEYPLQNIISVATKKMEESTPEQKIALMNTKKPDGQTAVTTPDDISSLLQK